MPLGRSSLACAARLALVVAWAPWSVPQAAAQGRTPQVPRLMVEADGSASAVELLAAAGDLGAPVGIRVELPSPADEGGRAIVAAAASRGTPIWLAVPAPQTEAALDAWRTSLRRIIDRPPRPAVLEIVVDDQPQPLASFAVQVAATEARARDDSIQVAVGGRGAETPARRAAFYTPAVAPYVDLLVVREHAELEAAEWLQRLDPSAGLIVRADVPGANAGREILDAALDDLGTRIASRSWPVQGLDVSSLRVIAPIARLLTHEVSVLDARAVSLSLEVSGADATASVPHRVLFDGTTFSTLLVYRGGPAEEPLAISLRVPVEGTPGVHDLLSGTRQPLRGYSRDAATSEARGEAPLTGRPMLVDFNEDAVAIGAGTTVAAERSLRVDEIISKHRQQQLAQDRLVRHYVAHASWQQYFRPQETDPGYEIATRNRYFVAEDGIEWEELSFAVNGRRFGEDRPALPMLQAEEVLAVPLQLRLDEGYAYELAGTARVDGFECYEVRFEPLRDDPSLYRGTVWIDRRTFARVRLHAMRGGLPGMVVSNDETLRYAPVTAIDGAPVFLLAAVDGSQNVLIAGRTIRVDKRVRFERFEINGDSFLEQRETARRSDRIMFRETPKGLRYYVKQDGTRVVSDRPTASVKAMALGVVVDPSYQFPLPIFGINYIDFGFVRPDTQLALLFGGVLAAGNIQRPQLGASRLDASLDFFAIAAPSSDRVYDASGERESERLLTWPLSTGINVGWRATPFQRFTAQYQLRFDGYVRDTTTAETFEPPRSTVTNGIGGAWEYSRRGYTVNLNAMWFTRARWDEWGPGGATLTTPRQYVKYGASISRDIAVGVFQRVHLNAAWFGGRDLDRFVKYQFGMFDATRIHGVPAAVRFSELALARGSYSVNVFDQYRVDVFLDHGWGRDRDTDRVWQRLPGVGAAFNLPAPWNTILRAEAGHSWLPDRYGRLGSTGLQVMLLKPLR